jgi:hypothetical protein
MGQWMRNGVGALARRRQVGAPQPLVTLPRGRDRYVLLDAHAFRNAMNVLVAGARTPFTVLVIRPTLPNTTSRLADLVLDQIRAGSGDLAGFLEAVVAVTVQGTRQGALRLCERLRDDWRRLDGGDLRIDVAEHPLEEQRAIDLLTADWSEERWMPVVIDARDPSDQPRLDAPDETRAGVAKRQ